EPAKTRLCVVRVKRAVTDRSVLTLTVHKRAGPAQAPLQPWKKEPAAGMASSVTWVPGETTAWLEEQPSRQVTAVEVTRPLPVASLALTTVRMKPTGPSLDGGAPSAPPSAAATRPSMAPATRQRSPTQVRPGGHSRAAPQRVTSLYVGSKHDARSASRIAAAARGVMPCRA